MKTVFTTWNGRIAPVFDVAGRAVLVITKNATLLSETPLVLPGGSVMEKISFLADSGTDILVCGAISRQAMRLVMAYGITVHPFIAGPVPDVIQAWLEDSLDQNQFAMPGCGRRMRCRGRRGRGFRKGFTVKVENN